MKVKAKSSAAMKMTTSGYEDGDGDGIGADNGK